MTGIIYFVETNNLIKIGYTASNPRKRIAQLQTGCPSELDFMGYYHGTKAQEKQLHLFCAAQRVRGEWFEIDGPVFHYMLDACVNQANNPL